MMGTRVEDAMTLSLPIDAEANELLSRSPLALLSYAAPVSNDPVTIAFQQHVSATERLRTGSYSKLLTSPCRRPCPDPRQHALTISR